MDEILLIVDSISECCKMSHAEALQLPMSYESIYFNSLAYEEHKKRIKNNKEINDRVYRIGNEIIKALRFIVKYI